MTLISPAHAPDRIPLRVYLLGSFRLERQGRSIHLPTRKAESLCAYLALHPEPHPREKLAALLWGGSTDAQARHSLRTALASLRRALGEDVLLADRETVQINPDFPVWVDAHGFQSAPELYTGDLLSDFYDDWVLPERERLRALYIEALLQQAQLHRAQSEYARAIDVARQVLTCDHANECAYQHLIFCLSASGYRAQALEAYAECERVLRSELNVAPSRETTALSAQIEAEMTGGAAREAQLTNLPLPPSSFVGRRNEIAQVKSLLETARLVTLVGAGGCGKTRLAIQVGTELAASHSFKHGVWWVDLSALQDPALVLPRVARVFDLQESGDLPLAAPLANYLRTKTMLLVLDSCEHLIDACAGLAGTLLPVCPTLRILATSRERLNASGEFVWYVPSMTVPASELPLEQLHQYDAIQLFVERARAAAPHWSLAGNGAAVANICAQLDGIPLAIELAAARLNVLSAEQISRRLIDRFSLLIGGRRTELPRHQTLRGAIDWSYDLLSEDEGKAFRQLSAFNGGWTLEAAEGVVGPLALELLTALVDKSLVIAAQRENATRYGMLETIRQYGHAKLEAAGELRAARDRHLDHFLNLAEQAYPQLFAGDAEWLDRIERDYDNMRAALEHALATDPESAQRLGMALEGFWIWHDRKKEGCDFAVRLLPLTEPGGTSPLRARALALAGALAVPPDQPIGRALEFVEAGLEMARAVGDKYCVAWALSTRAQLAIWQGDWPRVRASVQEAKPLFEELDIAWGVVYGYYYLGMAAAGEGDLQSAQSLLERFLVIARQENLQSHMGRASFALGDLARLRGDYTSARELYGDWARIEKEVGNRKSLAGAYARLAQVALHEGDLGQAKTWLEESLAVGRTLHTPGPLVGALNGFAAILSVTGDYVPSAHLFGVVWEASIATMNKRTQATGEEMNRMIATVREHIGEEAFQAAWEEGRKMVSNKGPEQALEQALEFALEKVRAIVK